MAAPAAPQPPLDWRTAGALMGALDSLLASRGAASWPEVQNLLARAEVRAALRNPLARPAKAADARCVPAAHWRATVLG